MIEIPLTQGYVAIVDDEDVDLQNRKWYALNNGRTTYCVRSQWVGRDQVPSGYIRQIIHREVVQRMYGREINKDEVVDHINGNGLDNRRSNLRLCTQQQNAWNRSKHENTIGKMKGVSYHKGRSKPYRAQIGIDGKRLYLGYFPTPEAAHAAYMEAAVKYFGEFARAA